VQLVNADKKGCLVGSSAIFKVPPTNQSLTVALFRTTPSVTLSRDYLSFLGDNASSLHHITPSVAAYSLPSLVNGTCDDGVEKGGGAEFD
jgi:hypothetical protein